MDHPRATFDQELEDLRHSALEMGTFVSGMLDDALASLFDRNTDLANELRERDTVADEMDEAIVSYARREAGLLIGERTAEDVKIAIGSAFPTAEIYEVEIKGVDLVAGLPRSVIMTSNHVRDAVQEPLAAIMDTVRLALENTPPELAADIMRRGIVLAGGGALLRGMDHLIMAETGIPCYVAQDPLQCVVLGTAKCLEAGMMNGYHGPHR